MRIYPIFVILVTLFFSCFTSCTEDDDFSSNPNIRVSFSNDTISFDTVFTEAGSSRKTLMMYNRSKNSLNISSVKIMNPEKSGFSFVVDGVSGTEIKDTEILKKDSVYIYIMVRVNPNNSNNPLIIRDSIRFDINGNQQYVQLEAIGQDVFRWRGKFIENDTTLTGEKPFLIYDSLVINKNATLNLDKNVRMFFHSGAKVNVLGRINAKGTLEEPVVFRGDRTDNLFTEVPYDRIPGQWGGMFVDSLSFDNHFEYFNLRNSINGIYFKPSNLSSQKAVFKNSIVHNTTSDGVFAQNCDIKAENSLFSNAGGAVVKLLGGKSEFLHCTLANCMSWWGMRSGGTLVLGNFSNDNNPLPLIKCEFTNSIVSSSSSRASDVVDLRENKDIPFNHLFTNCLIKVNGSDDDNFVETVWKEDPMFKNINKNKDYYYNFQLDSLSPSINKGDLGKALRLPYDMLGVSRLQDEGPDIGCYEWVSTIIN